MNTCLYSQFSPLPFQSSMKSTTWASYRATQAGDIEQETFLNRARPQPERFLGLYWLIAGTGTSHCFFGVFGGEFLLFRSLFQSSTARRSFVRMPREVSVSFFMTGEDCTREDGGTLGLRLTEGVSRPLSSRESALEFGALILVFFVCFMHGGRSLYPEPSPPGPSLGIFALFGTPR